MIAVVCTDKDSHPERVLGWLSPERRADGTIERVLFIPWVRRPDRQPRPPAQSGTVQARCPTCRRTVPLRQETAATLCDAPRLRGFDISRWPTG